ncbi:MAG: TetR/AcrR family transcriptional regulator [Saprospiraceae bacterium]|nr:TetR/AcrR family transcriptional regulator [Saprospiraceae bacterium]
MVETISTRKVSVVLWYNFQIIKTRILSKAEELSRKYGFRAITMDELATQLGISKKTIYQYYADKNALVDDVLTTIISKSQEQCQITSIRPPTQSTKYSLR